MYWEDFLQTKVKGKLLQRIIISPKWNTTLKIIIKTLIENWPQKS